MTEQTTHQSQNFSYNSNPKIELLQLGWLLRISEITAHINPLPIRVLNDGQLLDNGNHNDDGGNALAAAYLDREDNIDGTINDYMLFRTECALVPGTKHSVQALSAAEVVSQYPP